MELSKRQEYILKFLEKESLSNAEILEKLKYKKFVLTKITLNRDLKFLEENNYISHIGEGRATRYKLSESYKLFRPVNFAEYFSVDEDDRKVQEEFNFEILSNLRNIFDIEEIAELKLLNDNFKLNIETYPRSLFKRELERLVIELCWKSSRLEGNTYTLLETETLIKEKIESKGHTREEAVMILNHKTALDFVIKNSSLFRNITITKIQKVHSLLTKDLNIPEGFRVKKVGIIGTKYKPLQERKEIEKAFSKLCIVINKEKEPLAKALIALVMISYIQGFVDGNKRTARIISTALLLANHYCPISYRNVDDFEYKKSLILFYEQNNLTFFKKIFINQFKFSLKEYF